MNKVAAIAILLWTTAAVAQREVSAFSTPAIVSSSKGSSASTAWLEAAKPGQLYYWEVTDTGKTTFPELQYFSEIPPTGGDFSAFSVQWTFAKKHPLIPSFELVGFDVTPVSEKGIPHSSEGTFDEHEASMERTMAKARHAIAAVLRY